MLCCVALVRTNVSEVHSASIIRATRIDELTSQKMAFFLKVSLKEGVHMFPREI
jgi:hypothetical protein